MREIKSITGLRVISMDEGAAVGTVSQVVVDLSSGAVLGLILGNGAAERGVLAADIETIGTDVIMVSRREVARHLSELPELEQRKSATTHLLPVFTDNGRRLGVISAIFIDPYEKTITRYEVSSGAIKDLAEGLLVLPIIPGTVHGQDAVIIPEQAVSELGRETGGLFARFSQWGDSARKQYQQVAESAGKMVDTGSETLKKEAAVVREKAKEVSEKAKVAGEKIGEKATEAGAKARQTVAQLGETAKGGIAQGKPAEEPHDASAEQLVPVPADDAAAEQITPVPPDDASAEQIVSAAETTSAAPESDAPVSECGEHSCGCGGDSQES